VYRFAVTIHARPPGATATCSVELGRESFTALELDSNKLTRPLPITFEQVFAALDAIDRVFIEPDGSFVWSGETDAGRWQLDGHLYDRNERVLFVQIQGRCPRETLDHLLRILTWPQAALVFQLQREAVILLEDEFRRYAARE